jgi:magnesium-transporting ATPase (P-type)
MFPLDVKFYCRKCSYLAFSLSIIFLTDFVISKLEPNITTQNFLKKPKVNSLLFIIAYITTLCSHFMAWFHDQVFLLQKSSLGFKTQKID